MSKMSIEDAATHFGVSKEAIHNRIRRGSLQSVVESGVKLVEIDGAVSQATNRTQTKKSDKNQDDKYYKFLEEQNVKLQEKVEKLEGETRTLRDQKERMLIEERIKIEQIYRDKDEQLKNILNTISSQFMLNTPMYESIKEPHVEADIEDIEDEPKEKSQRLSLKKYLKQSGFSEQMQEKIKKRFKKIKDDKRVVAVGKKMYIDLSKYDYSDIVR
ncbi:MAG: DNA-binding protein [Campylobacterales bacterium]|nr:DNA-binding protein [Campylobacterales bacterium]